VPIEHHTIRRVEFIGIVAVVEINYAATRTRRAARARTG